MDEKDKPTNEFPSWLIYGVSGFFGGVMTLFISGTLSRVGYERILLLLPVIGGVIGERRNSAKPWIWALVGGPVLGFGGWILFIYLLVSVIGFPFGFPIS